jgi:hypothetical protein
MLEEVRLAHDLDRLASRTQLFGSPCLSRTGEQLATGGSEQVRDRNRVAEPSVRPGALQTDRFPPIPYARVERVAGPPVQSLPWARGDERSESA